MLIPMLDNIPPACRVDRSCRTFRRERADCRFGIDPGQGMQRPRMLPRTFIGRRDVRGARSIHLNTRAAYARLDLLRRCRSGWHRRCCSMGYMPIGARSSNAMRVRLLALSWLRSTGGWSAMATAQALAVSPYFLSDDLGAFYVQANVTLPSSAGNVLALSDAAGQQVLNTLRRYGEPLPRHGNPQLVQRVFATGNPRFPTRSSAGFSAARWSA